MITGSKANHKEVYTQIKITGNTLLPADEYLRYAGLSDAKRYSDQTLLEVKNKIDR